MNRRDFLKITGISAAALGLTACGGSSSSTAAPASSAAGAAVSKWPTDAVTMYVPAKAGGGTDALCRMFIQGMERANGGTYVVVNDMAGNGTVACETVRTAKPDGLNLLAYHSTMLSSYATGLYDKNINDFQVLGLFTTLNTEVASNGIYVPKSSPFNTFEELVAYAKEHPGELTNAVQNGGNAHFGACLMEQTIGFDTIKVDSGSNTDRITALMGEQVDMSIIPTMTAAAYSKSGDLKCLMTYGAVAGVARDPNEPDVKTLGEINKTWDEEMPRCDMICFIAGPKGMAQVDIDAIHEVIKTAVADEEVKAGYAKMGTVVEYYTIEDATKMLQDLQQAFVDAAPAVTG